MQTVAKSPRFAAQLLQEKWSLIEDIFWSEAATVHRLKKRQPCCPQAPESKRLCAPHMAPPSSKPELGQQCPVVDGDQPWLNVVSLSLSDDVVLCKTTRWFFSASSLLCVFYVLQQRLGMPTGVASPAACSGFRFSPP